MNNVKSDVVLVLETNRSVILVFLAITNKEHNVSNVFTHALGVILRLLVKLVKSVMP